MMNRRSFVATIAGFGAALKTALGFSTPTPSSVPLRTGPKTVFVQVEFPVADEIVLQRINWQFPHMTILTHEWQGESSCFWPIAGITSQSPRVVLLYRDTPEDMYGIEPAEEAWILDKWGFINQRERHIDIAGQNWGARTK